MMAVTTPSGESFLVSYSPYIDETAAFKAGPDGKAVSHLDVVSLRGNRIEDIVTILNERYV